MYLVSYTINTHTTGTVPAIAAGVTAAALLRHRNSGFRRCDALDDIDGGERKPVLGFQSGLKIARIRQ